MAYKIEIHPLNAKGKYYVDQNVCLCTAACASYAPKNFEYNPEREYGYYVVKQPENPEEETLCQKAMDSCPVEAIYNDGEINLEKSELNLIDEKGN